MDFTIFSILSYLEVGLWQIMTDMMTTDRLWVSYYCVLSANPSAHPSPISKVPGEGTLLPDIWFGWGALVWKKGRQDKQRGSQTDNVSKSFQKDFQSHNMPGSLLCKAILETIAFMAIVRMWTIRSCQCVYCCDSSETH